MSAASDLTQASWQAFSRLLDEALELPPTERLGWLERLGAEHDAVRPALRAVLSRVDGVETAQWLATLPRVGAAPPPLDESDLQSDSLVGPYRLIRELGVGGMGAVWLAERADGTLKRQVALKLPRATWTRCLADRMARERDILAALEHPNIARLYDAGTDAQGRPYLALEYVEGQPIDAYCHEHKLSVHERVGLVLQVAQAVAYAHSRLVVHRDLKPSNILVTADGQVRLLDFGIAKLMEGDRAAETQLTRLAGRALTPDYASPEQIRGEPIGTASDVYSFGVVAFELLTAQRPYRLKRGSVAELEEVITSLDAPLASTVASDLAARRALKGDLDAILATSLRKDPRHRYPTVDALAQDIERYRRGEPVHARADGRWYRARKFIARNRLAVGATTMVLLAVVAGAFVALWQANLAREAARTATAEARRATAVQDFLLGIFQANSNEQSDPEKARSTTARELLDLGAGRVAEELKDLPDTQADVLNTLGEMYSQLGLKDRAAEMLRRRVELARQSKDPARTRLVEALLRYANALSDGPSSPEMNAVLAEARSLLDASGDSTSSLRAELAMLEAVYFADISLSRMRVAADEAVAIGTRRQQHDQEQEIVNGLRFAALARLRAGDPSEAETLMLRALSEVERRKSGQDAWRVSQLRTLAETRLAQLRVEDAEQDMRSSAQISMRLDGPSHLQTAYSRASLASLLVRTGRPSEAEREVASLRADLDAPGAVVANHTRRYVDQVSAAVNIERGQPELALIEIDRVMRFMDDEGGGPITRANVGRLRAEALILAGRGAEAMQDIAQASALSEEFLGDAAHPSVRNPFLLTKAKAYLASGNGNAALAAVEQMTPPAFAKSLPFVPDLLRGRLVRAEVLLKQRDASEAARLAAAVRDDVASAPQKPYFLPLLADATLLLGRAQRAMRQPEACATIVQALALRDMIDDAESARLQQLRSEARPCVAGPRDGR